MNLDIKIVVRKNKKQLVELIERFFIKPSFGPVIYLV